MGSSTPVPKYKGANYTNLGQALSQGSNLMPQGYEFLQNIVHSRDYGVPDYVKNIYDKQGRGAIGGALSEGKQALKESLTGTGQNIPLSAMLKGQNLLQTDANKSLNDLNNKLGLLNYQANQDSVRNYLGLMGIGADITGQKAMFDANQANSRNQYNLQEYDINESNRFKIGDALGALIGAGSNVASVGVSRKK